MRKITRAIASSFQHGKAKCLDNTRTDGESIWLHGNKIVEKREDGVYVSLSRYGYSRTTAERLAAFCSVHTRKGTVYLNGNEWDGEWAKVA